MEVSRINVGRTMEGVTPAREVQHVSENNATTQESIDKNQKYKFK